jgi:peptidoglycan/xylan/chitin deacetylase (PgdA/CDA1 family)
MRGLWKGWLVTGLLAGLLLAGCGSAAPRDGGTAPPAGMAAVAPVATAAPTAAAGVPFPTADATATAQPAEGVDVRLVYEIDRSRLPLLPYRALTLRVYVGEVEEVAVLAAGETAHWYGADSGWVTVTTEADEVALVLEGAALDEGRGAVEKAALKDGKAWAWSHSMDDNGNLHAAIDVMRQYGWRGTLYVVSDWIAPEDTGGYLLNETDLGVTLQEGWALGNHTRDHQCDPAKIDRQTVIDGEARLRAIVESSNRPDYRLMSFAAPCMEWTYDPLLREMMAEGLTEALFNEADKRDDGYQNQYRIVVAAEGEVEEDWRTVRFDPALPVGRNFDFESGEEGKGPEMVKRDLDEIAALAKTGVHVWYNTASHGNGEERLLAVGNHIYTNYGPGGTDEVWVAPAEEIYSYLLVRELAVVRRRGQ